MESPSCLITAAQRESNLLIKCLKKSEGFPQKKKVEKLL